MQVRNEIDQSIDLDTATLYKLRKEKKRILYGHFLLLF